MEEKKAPAAQPDPKKKAVAALVAAAKNVKACKVDAAAARERLKKSRVERDKAAAAARQLGLHGQFQVGGEQWRIAHGKVNTVAEQVSVTVVEV